MLTPSATRFVGPLSFAALSRHPVETDVLDLLPDGRIGHIVLADSADAIVVAPATAHWLGAMANGMPGDVVTATCLATSAPVVVAPAMDGDMWTHPATAANVRRLRDYGYAIVEPESGPLASGQSGVGRLAELVEIVEAVVAAVGDRPVRAADPAARPPLVEPAHDADLAGRHVVVTAGGTREAIDPVRFIGNRSTGRMGAAIAAAALDRGAQVTVIAADIDVRLSDGVVVVPVELTAELRAALLETVHAPDGSAGFDALIMAAAVADFRPATRANRKLERGGHLTLELEPTPDLLAEVARIARGLDSEGAPAGEADRARAGAGRVRGGDRLTRPGRPTSSGASGSISSSPTTWLSPGRASGPRRTACRSWPPTARARTFRCWASAPSPSACSIMSHACWTSATPPRRLVRRPRTRTPRSQHERHDRHRSPPDRHRHRQAVRRRRPHPDADRLRLSDCPDPRQAGIPMLLVGDSVGQVMLGYESTVRVTMAEMVHYTRAVVRGSARALVVADMPFLTYATPEEALENAGTFLRDAGAQAVKVEGGVRSARIIEVLVRAGIPVMGHIGLTPQAINAIGKVRVQGKSREQARSLIADALAVQEAGAFSMVLELVPEQLAAAITERLRIPTIGIGAGAGCSGQVQVVTDLIGLGDFVPRHARPYAHVREAIAGAAAAYAADVAAGTFPGPEQTVRMDDAVLDEALGRGAADRPDGRHPGRRHPARPGPLNPRADGFAGLRPSSGRWLRGAQPRTSERAWPAPVEGAR